MSVRFIGEEINVNATTTWDQLGPAITYLTNGRYVVTWTSWYGAGTTAPDVFGRLFNADGTPVGDDFMLNADIEQYALSASVMALSNGGFVATWEADKLYARIFDGDGNPVSGEIAVNTTTDALWSFSGPVIAPRADGGFFLSWSFRDENKDSYDVRGRAFGPDGTPLGDDFYLNSTTLGLQMGPSAAAFGGDQIVVVWTHSLSDGTVDVRGRLFGSDGTPAGDDFAVTSVTEGYQAGATVTSLEDGRFVVTWQSEDAIHARLFDADGIPAGADFDVSTSPLSAYSPIVTALAGGGFVVTWTVQDTPATTDVVGRIFDASGAPVGDEFLVNTLSTEGSQGGGGVTALPDGSFVVTWNTDLGGTWDIKAQRFTVDSGPNAAPTALALTNDSVAEHSENGTVVGTFAVTDPDANEDFAFALVDDAGGRFRVEGDKLLVARGDMLEFDDNTSHEVVVKLRDAAGHIYEQGVTINIENVPGADVPVITSNGGGDNVAIDLAENIAHVTTVTANGTAPLTYSIAGGVDAHLFSIDAATGALAFATAPDYERRADDNRDSVYEVLVRVENASGGFDMQALAVTVTDVTGIFNSPSNAPVITGTPEADYLIGLSGANIIRGLADRDDIYGGGGNDTIEGGDGGDNLHGDGGNDTLHGDGGNDSLYGDAGHDTLHGDDGNDNLTGGAGHDMIFGDAGDDAIFHYAGDGADTIDGGDGYDSLIFYTLNLSVTFDGTKLTLPGFALNSVENISIGGASTLSYVNTSVDLAVDLEAETASGFGSARHISNVTGGSGNDVLSGSEDYNILNGGGGDDVLMGRDRANGGNLLIGGSGNDTVSYAEDWSLVIDLAAGTGSWGWDTQDTLQSIENVIGTSTDDEISGTTGANRLEGGEGSDLIDGRSGNDTLLGGEGDDDIIGGKGYDTLEGGMGDDTFRYATGDGVDTISGGDGYDRLDITGTSVADKLDVIFDGASITRLIGGTVTGVETAIAHMGDGVDRLNYTGTTVGVTVDLSLGHASGFSEISGIETVMGGSGNDSFIGDAQANTFAGGMGDDSYVLGAGDTAFEAAGAGIDTVSTASDDWTLAGNIENLTYIGTGDFTGIGNRGDNIITGGMGSDTLSGGIGADALIGGAGDDTLNGGNGDDILNSGAGSDTVTGGSGDDVATYGLGENMGSSDSYAGGSGNDTLHLELTAAEWMNAGIRDDIQAFQSTLEAGQHIPFHFTAFDLTVREFESVEVVVDGVTVDFVDDPVDAITDEFFMTENDVTHGNVLANDFVPDGIANVSLVEDVIGGDLTLNGDGSFIFDTAGQFDSIPMDYDSGVRFRYQVTDLDGDTSMAYAYMFVWGVNDTPVANDDMAAVSEDGPGIVIDLVGNDTDVDSLDVLNIASFDFSGLKGSVLDNGDGTVTYSPNGAFEALSSGDTDTDSFTYMISDGEGGFDTAQVTIEIAGEDEALFGGGNLVAANLRHTVNFSADLIA